MWDSLDLRSSILRPLRTAKNSKKGGVYLIVYLLQKMPKKEGYEMFRNPLFLFGRGERI